MIAAVLTLLAGILAIAVIIVLNGYFVSQEFAFMSVDRTQLRALAEKGDKRAQSALKITHRTSFMLSGSQLGITVTGLLVGFIAEPLVGESLGELLSGTGIPLGVAVAVGTVVALALSTVTQMIFGELFPKNYTIAAPMKSSLALARSTQIYLTVTGWLISFFDFTSNALLKILRIKPVDDIDSAATEDDLEHIVAASRQSGELGEEAFFALDRLLDFPEHDVGHAMLPRSRADVVAPETTIAEVRELMVSEHTRYPIINEEHEPVGVVHLVDVISTKSAGDTAVTEIMREPVVVPELMLLPDVVEQLHQRSEELACVIDEYGGFIGIITLEDLAEEILGDITDEHDHEQTEQIDEVAEHLWVVDGDTPIDEIERTVDHDLPEGDFETVSGLLLAHAGGLVDVGESYDIDLEVEAEDYVSPEDAPSRKLRMNVEEIEHRVPSRVRIEFLESSPEGDPDEGGSTAVRANHDGQEDN